MEQKMRLLLNMVVALFSAVGVFYFAMQISTLTPTYR